MIESIPWDAVSTGGATTLLGITVWLILSGRLIPKSTYDVMVKAKEHWRDAATEKDKTIATLVRTVDKQTVIGDSVEKTMTAVQEAREADSP